MAGKEVSTRQAENALLKCEAPKVDSLFIDERPGKLVSAAANGANAAQIQTITGGNKNVGKCVAVEFGLEEPSTLTKVSGWLQQKWQAAGAAAQEVAQDVAQGISQGLRNAQPGTTPGTAERGSTQAEFCQKTADNPNPSARDAKIAERICAPKV